MTLTFRLEGLEDTVNNLGQLPRATSRNVVRRVLQQAAEPVASIASGIAPSDTGRLAFSIVVTPQLTRRHRGAKINEVEVYIGAAGGAGALNYASFVEFGTIDTPAKPFLRPAWDATQSQVLQTISVQLGNEVERAAGRLARRQARLAAGG